jgi:uncharacterized protein YgbK (DUF1537 family)
VVVHATPEDEELGDPDRVVCALALAAAGAFRAASPGALALFGGETALAVLRELGVAALRPRTELWPGVIESAAAGGLTVITKSGGFGPEDVFERLGRLYRGGAA